jgi:cellulose synthase/poly-beta-1,6-N-acetylglucosamine synthase-like glycosyltransferase
VRFLGSFNVGFPRKVLEEVGGFHEEYRHASGEDNDLSYRIRKRGYRLLFEPRARVAHMHPERLGSYLREQARHGYWRMKLYRDHPERMGGDDYSGPADFVEPPAALAALLLLPWTGITWVRGIFHGVLLLLLLTAFVPTVAIVRATGVGSHALLLGVRFLRSFARAIGMALGLFHFWGAPALRRLVGGSR